MTRKILKKYTKGLSLKDKSRQKKNIKTARRSYKRGKYVSRPKLKSFKKKESGWTAKFHKRYPEAKSVLWTFEKGATSTDLNGVYEYKKRGKYRVQADVVTGCGDIRTYTREIFFIDPYRRNRRRKDKKKDKS